MAHIWIVSVLFLFLNSIESKLHDSFGCAEEEFPCINGQCIFKMNWCDGTEQCKDKSDEKYCLHRKNSDPNLCSDDPSLFLCKDGRCIPSTGKCDGIFSCYDKSDEENCFQIEEELSTYLESNAQNNLNNQSALSYSNDYNYYSDVRYENHKKNLEDARNWLLSKWDQNSGWGEDTARAIIALYLSNDNNETDQKLLMTKQLEIQLFVALTRNSSKELSLCDLSHYINALTATCRNPRKFNGNDLVSALRDKVDIAVYRKDFVNPYVYLTLCIHNFTKYEDIKNMQISTRSKLSVVDKFDMLSLSVLFASCVKEYKFHYNPNFRTDILSLLVNKIHELGIPKSVYELSLVVQAMTEAKVDPSRWHKEEAMDFILDSQMENGSFGDFLATYYTIPILSGRSILDISTHCNKNFSQVPQTDSKHSKIRVFYSLKFGFPVEMTQRIDVRVTEGTNFLHIMHLAEEKSHYFRFKLDETKGIPFVYSIGGVPNDPERGIYWSIESNINRPELNRYDYDLRHFIPKNDEEVSFWHRPVVK